MAAHAKTKIFYISLGFWLIIGVESFDAWSNHRLTVQTGGSVTIPCHYDKKYTQQKKYWFSEIDQTYRNTSKENLSIIDHPDQNLFTVSLRNLENEDTGPYSCVVDTEGNLASIYEVYLNVQSALGVSVVSSSVSGHEGGDISVKCLYSSEYQNDVKRWCRYKDQSCYTVGRTDTSQNSSVQISDDDDGGRSFTVLMTGLRLTDSGWYFCFAGQAVSPVHLTVTEAEPDKEKDTSKSGHHKNNNNNTTEVTGNPQNNKLLNVWLPVSAALLLLLILFIVFTWRLRRRPKEQDEQQIRERNGSRTIGTCEIQIYSKPEYPVIYSTINDENPNDANKDITTYSTIDNVPGSEARPPAVGTIYCTVAPHQQQE